MRVVLDTSVLIDHLHGYPRATAALAEALEHGHDLCSVTVVRTEVLAGMRPAERVSTLALLDSLLWHDVTVPLADRAGELARTWLGSHPGVDTVDFLIAAAVEELGGALWTRNLKHFPMSPGLQAPYA